MPRPRPANFDYQRYLASREWALLREQVRERSGGWCERCGLAPHQDTHHLTYARIGRERLEDLLAVCRPCHLYVSGKSSYDPLQGWQDYWAWVVAESERLLAKPCDCLRCIECLSRAA